MSQAQCIRYPIRPGRREHLVRWIAGLEERESELAQAFAEAGLVAEAVFLEKSDRGDSLLIYTTAEDLEAATRALDRSALPLVLEFNRVLAEAVEIERAVALDRIFHTD